MSAEVVVVVGACGGVGTSTVAALLARERARDGRRVALVDLDARHGGVEVLLGIETAAGARWPDLHAVRGTVDAGLLDGVLPWWEGVEVLSAGRSAAGPSAGTVTAVGEALAEANDTVVVDLPAEALADAAPDRWPGSPSETLLVTGQDVLGVAAALPWRSVLGVVPAQVVLRRRRRAQVSPLEVAQLLDLPVLATVPTARRLADAVDRGFGPVVGRWSATGRAIRRVARGVGDG